MKEIDLPIYGLANPMGMHPTQDFNSQTNKNCGCMTKKAPLVPYRSLVLDGVTNMPFEAGLVNIYNTKTRQGTTPDTKGKFEIYAYPNDSIRISFVGYQTQEILAKDLPSVITLLEDQGMLNEVVITSKKSKNNHFLLGLGLTAMLLVYAIAKDEKQKE